MSITFHPSQHPLAGNNPEWQIAPNQEQLASLQRPEWMATLTTIIDHLEANHGHSPSETATIFQYLKGLKEAPHLPPGLNLEPLESLPLADRKNGHAAFRNLFKMYWWSHTSAEETGKMLDALKKFHSQLADQIQCNAESHHHTPHVRAGQGIPYALSPTHHPALDIQRPEPDPQPNPPDRPRPSTWFSRAIARIKYNLIQLVNSIKQSFQGLVELGALIRARRQGTTTAELNRALRFWGESEQPWAAYTNTHEGRTLATLLQRLKHCRSFQQPRQVASILELRAILGKMLTDAAFRAYCFDQCMIADADCSDQVQAIFDELRTEFNNPARGQNATLENVIQFQKGKLSCTLIDEYVTTLSPNSEAIESGQELKRALSKKLNLPIEFHDISHAIVGVVSRKIDYHMEQATQYVKNNLTLDRLTRTMVDENASADFLKKTFPIPFAAISLLFQDVLEVLQEKNGKTENGATNDPTDVESAIAQAMALPTLGTGHEVVRRQALANQLALKEAAHQALNNPSLSKAEIWEQGIGALLASPAWNAYLEKQANPLPLSKTDLTLDLLKREAGLEAPQAD